MGLVEHGSKAASNGASGRGCSLVAEIALIAKRHLDLLDPGEKGELRELLVKSKGTPGQPELARARAAQGRSSRSSSPAPSPRTRRDASTPFAHGRR